MSIIQNYFLFFFYILTQDTTMVNVMIFFQENESKNVLK